MRNIIVIILIFLCQSIFAQKDTIEFQNNLKVSTPSKYSLFSVGDSGLEVYTKPKAEDYFFKSDTINKYFIAIELERKGNKNWRIKELYLRIYYNNGEDYKYHELKELPKNLRKFFRKAKFIVNSYSGNQLTLSKTIQINISEE